MEFSTHFTYKKIISATIPPIVMMIFTSLYSVVDGLFLSNFAGKEAFSAVGFITPYLMMFNAVGFMFGTGGSALIAKLLGEQNEDKASQTFTTLVISSVIVGLILSLVGQTFLRFIAELQGASGILLENSLRYGRVYLLGVPFCLVQFEFQALYQTSGKGKLGLKVAIIVGLTNVFLDLIFLAFLDLGIVGASLRQSINQMVDRLISLFYFIHKNNIKLKLFKTKLLLKEKFKYIQMSLVKWLTIFRFQL